MTRALISGISGFVGSHLAEFLLANTDWQITGMMRWNSRIDNLVNLIPEANEGSRLRLVNADLCDAGSVRTVISDEKLDYVFHLAAQSYPLTSFTAPADTLQTNIIGTLNILEAVRGSGQSPVVHICSSSEVYGRVARENVPINEACPFGPASPYAISKVGADLLAQLYAAAYEVRTVVTRMFTHTGPRRGDVFAESSFAKQIAMIEAGQMEPPVMVGNLDSLRTVLDVRDAVRAYFMAVTVDPIPGEVYNIGGSHSCTVGDILDALFIAAGMRYDVQVDPARLRPVDADLQVPDCSKFTTHTGWKPEISFETTMSDLFSYWQEKVKSGPCLQR